MLVVPRLVLDNIIREGALASGGAFRQVKVKTVEAQPAGVRVTGEAQGKPVSFEAPVAVVATGANVKLLRQMELVRRAPSMILAARTYFEEVGNLADQAQFHFGGAPLPGYGWVFPLSATSANVGVGFFPRRWFKGRLPASPAKALDTFLSGAAMQSCLGPARRVGAVKGYPLRMDFTTAPTFAGRVLLVGEAAGLVNPLTGEGIDYALESGRIAAGHIAALLGSGDFSSRNLLLYDDLLRRRFQRLFRFCEVVRMLCLNRICLNLLIRWAVYRPDLKRKLIDIVLGSGGLPAGSR
jgi:flavin-dependent dehydrogenase